MTLSIFEWSGRDEQRLLADWRRIRTDADVDAVVAILRATERRKTSVSTGLGTAMLFAGSRAASGPLCSRLVLDVSGDGRNNDGPRPQDVGPDALRGLNVNALVIGAGKNAMFGAQANETNDLVGYFRAYVLRGPDAFAEIADGYDDYAEAMKRKLLKELEVLVLGENRPPERHLP